MLKVKGVKMVLDHDDHDQREIKMNQTSNSTSTHHDGGGDVQKSAVISPHQNPSEIQMETNNNVTLLKPKQFIQKVPLVLLKEDSNRESYFPKVVSIGPYHHGKPELRLVEEFKKTALDLFVSDGTENQEFYYNKVLDEIVEIKSCYQENHVTDMYSDRDLARMMLLDGCFIIIYLHTNTPEPEFKKRRWDPDKREFIYNSLMTHLGMLTLANVQRDLFLLENQIPFRVLKLLMDLRYGRSGHHLDLPYRYLNEVFFREFGWYIIPGLLSQLDPFHLLQAFHMLIASKHVEPKKNCPTSNCTWLCYCCNNDDILRDNDMYDIEGDRWKYRYSFRSVTQLKAKGIHFKPSCSQFLTDVTFKPKFIYAQLRLPAWFVSIHTKVFFLNMIAYEFDPLNPTNGEVTSYVNLMKSLIERPEDVKELREKKILYISLGSDETVFHMYKDINTYGAENRLIFRHVKKKIQAHCNSKTKTWIAELIHNYFRSPWTFIALLAAMTLLALTVVQVHYAIHPNSK